MPRQTVESEDVTRKMAVVQEKPVQSQPPLLLTQPDLASLLQVSPRKIRAMTSTGQVPGVIKLGRCIRYRRADIEKWIASGCKRAA